MKKAIFLIVVFGFLFLINPNNYGQSESWLWATSAGSPDFDYVSSMALDKYDNIYLTGYLPYYSTFGISQIGIADFDLLLAKYSSSGELLGSIRTGGGLKDYVAESIAVDSSGNLYLAGEFECSTITLGSTKLTNCDSTEKTNDLFLAKYDASGNNLWALSAGESYIIGTLTLIDIDNGKLEGYHFESSKNGSVEKYKLSNGIIVSEKGHSTILGEDHSRAIVVGPSGNSYLAGQFCSPTITFGSNILKNEGEYLSEEIFLAKFDSNGNVLWAKSAQGTKEDRPISLTIDEYENIYMAGIFRSSILAFNSKTLTNTDSTGITYDVFISKYDPDGNVLWVKNIKGKKDDICKSIVADASGNYYLAGNYYSPTLNFNSIALKNTDNTGNTYDVFISKFDRDGNVLWVMSPVGAKDDSPNGLAIDGHENIYLAGTFKSPTLTFNTNTLRNADKTGKTDDIFLVKFDADGNVLKLESVGGKSLDMSGPIAADSQGNIYLAGMFFKTLTIGPNTLKKTRGGFNISDIFLAKYGRHN